MLGLEVIIGFSVFAISFLFFLILTFTNLSFLRKEEKKEKEEEKRLIEMENLLGLNKPLDESQVVKTNPTPVKKRKAKLI